jgi:hypothetical protein
MSKYRKRFSKLPSGVLREVSPNGEEINSDKDMPDDLLNDGMLRLTPVSILQYTRDMGNIDAVEYQSLLETIISEIQRR